MRNDAKRLLVADVDEKARQSLLDLFTREGYRVELTRLASEVIRKIQNTRIDVLIMDVDISGMKGYQIIPIIKKMEPALPIIVTSSRSSLKLAQKVRQEKIFFYAMKPLDLKEIKLVVKDALRKIGKIR